MSDYTAECPLDEMRSAPQMKCDIPIKSNVKCVNVSMNNGNFGADSLLKDLHFTTAIVVAARSP